MDIDTKMATATDLCTFEKEHQDYQSGESETFRCDVERIEGKDLCLFHDESYLKDSNQPENKRMVIEKLKERIENSKKK